jgi:hypothetical protein
MEDLRFVENVHLFQFQGIGRKTTLMLSLS